jgi:hypothetical protein
LVSTLGSGVHAAAARGPTRYTRRAPYDYGCVFDPPCSVQVKRARNGTLDTATVLTPGLLYGPPFVAPAPTPVGTTASIVFSTKQTKTVTVGAYFRDLDQLATKLTSLMGCIEVLSQRAGQNYFPGCGPLSPGHPRWVSGSLQLPRGTYTIVSSIVAYDDPIFGSVSHPISVRVDAISYTLG